MTAAKLGALVYRHPRLWYRMVEKEPQIILRYYDVVRGLEDIGDFYDWMFGMINAKPWKVVRSWIESRMIKQGRLFRSDVSIRSAPMFQYGAPRIQRHRGA